MTTRPTIGIRREDKNPWERRAPLTPAHVHRLVGEHELTVVIQPSPRRIYDDAAYREAGAVVQEDLSACPMVLGVKEIPTALLQPKQGYVYFAHVIKGQAYNMDMLQTLLERGCHLIDYERIVDDAGRRLVFFGRHAGLAGMIDTLWTLGERLTHRGVASVFAQVDRAHAYRDLDDAKGQLRALAEELKTAGVPAAFKPMIFGFTGYGNVSRGAQEILDLFPTHALSPAQLAASDLDGADPAHTLFKVEFHEEHMVASRSPGHAFELQDYYDHPERYRSTFAPYLDKLSVLVNCIYWDTPYPRLLTREDARRMWAGSEPKLQVIGDISCDIDGAIEITGKATTVDNPVFVHEPVTGELHDGVAGAGPAIMAVDNLPCELPAEATQTFGDALLPFIPALGSAEYESPLAELAIPDELRRALIVYQGRLTPDYEYLTESLAMNAK